MAAGLPQRIVVHCGRKEIETNQFTPPPPWMLVTDEQVPHVMFRLFTWDPVDTFLSQPFDK